MLQFRDVQMRPIRQTSVGNEMSEKKESAISHGSNEIIHPFDPIVINGLFYESVLKTHSVLA